MNLTPKGKIGRLPKTLRDEVNRRLDNGEKGHRLVAWLNSLAEVQAMLATEFQGKPISEQNLAKWRANGYKQWTWRKEALAMAAEIGDLPVAGTGATPLSDQMAAWVSARYLMTVRALVENKLSPCSARREECSSVPASRPQTESNLKILRSFSRDIAALRRGDQSSARLKMQQNRRKHQAQVCHMQSRAAGRFDTILG